MSTNPEHIIHEFFSERIKEENRKKYGEPKSDIIKVSVFIAILAIVWVSILCGACGAETGTASYFSRESCIKEGTLTKMSNGKELNDNTYVCASWKYKIGTLVRISARNGKYVICKVTTRGPGRKNGTSKYYKGVRIADLSVAAFSKLAPLSAGIITVTVEAI